MLRCIHDYPSIQLAHHSRVLVVTSRESMYSRVSFMVSRESFAGCSTTYPRMYLLTFKHKTCTNWRLVNSFNFKSLNCYNFPNLRELPYFTHINTGLGEGVRYTNLERKVILWIVYRSLWSSGTQNPLVAEDSLSQALGCNLNSFIIANKENPSSICISCIVVW